MEPVKIYLGLGSNTGNKADNLKRAIEKLSLALGSPAVCSSFMESEPWGYSSENSYLNCAVMLETTLAPEQLLDTTEQIERDLGRKTKSIGGMYGDRPIDIDILFYGDERITTPRLTIPHPLLHEREFVLAPLLEIAPALTHPTTGKTIATLLSELRDKKNGTEFADIAKK